MTKFAFSLILTKPTFNQLSDKTKNITPKSKLEKNEYKVLVHIHTNTHVLNSIHFLKN